MTSTRQKLLGFTCLATIPALLAMPAHAQDTVVDSTAQSADGASDLIVVTGSRIERSIQESAVPLQILGAEDLEESGTVDLAEAVIELPGVSASISPQSSNDQIQTAGLSTIDLRRLGDDRTLVLINGKRAVSNSGNSDRVSLSTLPSGFIKRVEVTTGGASAVYGSDAIAGVANFVLEDNFQGAEFEARYLTPEASGGEDLELNAMVGKKFNDNRGYIMVAGSYRDVKIIAADKTRPESILALEFDDPDVAASNSFANELGQPGCDPSNVERHCLVGSFSGSTPGGVFEGGDAWYKDGQWFNDIARTNPNGRLPSDRNPGQDFYSDYDGYNTRIGQSLIGARRMFNVGANLTYEFSPAFNLSLIGLYSMVHSNTAGGYETLNDSDTFGSTGQTIGNIASSNPFIPPEVHVTRSGSVDFDRSLVELGIQRRLNKRETVRFIGDVSGSLSDKWEYELYSTYGKFYQRQINTNEYNHQKAQWALDVETVGGVIRCRNAAARADGCVPLNIFGEGTISPEAADYIRYTGNARQTRTQFTAGGFVRGELFDLWAGPVKAVFGVEYRYEGQETHGDPDGDLVGGLDGDPTTDDVDQTSLATFPDIKASYRVKEMFGELDVPLWEDTLDLQLAARVADYNTVGTIFSYNAGLVFRPMDGLRFRAQYSRSQRAPNLTEFFSLPRPDADDLIDPCEGLMPDGSGVRTPAGVGGSAADLAVLTSNCLADPGIQAYFADPANAGLAFDDGDSSTQGPNAGNPNLKEETADTYTFGVVATPRFIPGLTLTLDYYRISIKDAITSIDTQDTVDLCYTAADYPNNKFCDVITRNQASGEIIEVINYQENLNRERVEGIDAGLFYKFKPGFVPGRFDVDVRYTHYLTQDVKFTGIGGQVLTSSPLGEIGTPKDELRLKLGYRLGDFRFTYTMTYLGGGVDDLVAAPNPTDDRYYKVKGQDYHRIYASYDFGKDDQYRIYGGINNLFNDYGPFMPDGLNNGNFRNIVSPLNDPAGREFYVGVRARF
ncbi:MAG: TonB-dependent receptor [Sphingopyxis sp.]|uniref:TonB-dependent receptor plug domain-containing protein n=1 Tax=Sphingopyxis sp. TaxID=1908224 RepID=UPI002ABA580B|nr:TonB-dependent receptor [Sphingopyxis sp.]MDZ3833294.1 TonB-dependent receptor [Sphingopyxis sp.]